MMGVEEIEGYREAKNEHDAAVAVAERSDDEVGKLKAQLSWTTKERDFEKQWTARAESEAKLASVKEQIKKDFPNVPASLLNHITDPEALLAVAKDMNAQIDKSVNNWGKPGGAAGGGTGGGEDAGGGYTKHELDELVKRVNTGNPQAVKDYRKWVMTTRIMPFAKIDTTRSTR